MATVAHPSRVSQLVRLLPGPLLAALDAWSQRLARRRFEARQRRWRERQAIAAQAAQR